MIFTLLCIYIFDSHYRDYTNLDLSTNIYIYECNKNINLIFDSRCINCFDRFNVSKVFKATFRKMKRGSFRSPAK